MRRLVTDVKTSDITRKRREPQLLLVDVHFVTITISLQFSGRIKLE
jgi:hypothetical protein